MKLRSFYSVLVGVVLVLLLVSGVGAVWLTAGSGKATLAAQPSQSSAGQSPAARSARAITQPASADSTLFISRQAVAVLSLLSNPEQLSRFWLSDLSDSPLSGSSHQTQQAELESLPQQLFAEFGLDYNRDLKAWLGDQITFAVMTADVDRDAATGLQPGYLLVLAVENPQQAEAAVQAFWQRQAGDLTTEQVAGVQIFSADAASDSAAQSSLKPSLASAIVGNQYVLFANYSKVLRTALNNAQVAELSLERNFSYQQALEQLSQPQTGFLFVNLPALNPNLQQRLTNLSQLDLSQYDSLILGLRPVAKGLLADATLLATSPTPPANAANLINVSSLLRFIPSRSHFAIASRDLPQVWAAATSQAPDWQQGLSDLQQKLGLPLADLTSQSAFLQNDFVLAELPHSGRADDWLLVVPQSAEAEAAAVQLDQLAQQQGLSLGSFQLGEQTIYAWTKLKPAGPEGAISLQAEVQGLRTETGDYALFATSLEALDQALLETDLAAGLQLTPTLPVPNQGYLYLDRASLERRLQPNGPLKKLLHSFQSALITRYGADETGQRAAAFLRLID